MTPPSEDAYRLAIFDHVTDFEELTEAFVSTLRIHPTDARVWARQTPGVLKENLHLADCERVIAALAERKIRSGRIKATEVPVLRHSVMIHRASCEPDGLHIIEAHGDPLTCIPWEQINVVCVGCVPLEKAAHYPSGDWTAVSAGRHYQRPEIATNTPLGIEVYLVCDAPYPSFRLDHAKMNYHYLGDRLVESATANFGLFIRDVIGYARRAFLPESTHAFLEHQHTDKCQFRDHEAFLSYATLQAVAAKLSQSSHPD